MSEDWETRPGGDELDPAIWGDAGLIDPFTTDAFTQEIADIDESDWNLDVDAIWGGDVQANDASPGDLPSGPELFG
ncbi:hypothetical protein [Microbacterium sp. NPDC058345]|uniref:hypothetical protein n=1 Tax=Microbacterium sp. NPDC058345 TaxID=3346455 RepID=UPI00365173DC